MKRASRNSRRSSIVAAVALLGALVPSAAQAAPNEALVDASVVDESIQLVPVDSLSNPADERASHLKPMPVNTREQWYGWKIALSDIASLTTFFVSANAQFDPGTTLGAVGLVAGAPVIHALHGQTGAAWLSGLARTGLATIALMHALGDSGGTNIASAGFLGVALIDFVTASRTVEVSPSTGATSSVTPFAGAAGDGGMQFGFSGRF